VNSHGLQTVGDNHQPQRTPKWVQFSLFQKTKTQQICYIIFQTYLQTSIVVVNLPVTIKNCLKQINNCSKKIKQCSMGIKKALTAEIKAF